MIKENPIHGPIDAVVLWVDGADDNHKLKMLPFLKDRESVKTKNFRTRYDQVDEVSYCVDSILKFASFVRNIFIVTDQQTPAFLKAKTNDKKYEKVKIIDHVAIFENDETYLPTFNCRSIETKLYKIPNLSEHFIYFNDDSFLLKETKPSDFFMNGLPILRGKWLRLDEDVFYKRWKNKKKKKRAGHKKAQQKAAKIVGLNRYFKFHHTPYPLRKSTFEDFFSSNRAIEIENIKHRFRHSNQFTPQGLANHIEIKNRTCIQKNDYQLCYIQSYKKPIFWYQFKLLSALKNPTKLFLCMQSLDQCPANKLRVLMNFLKVMLNRNL